MKPLLGPKKIKEIGRKIEIQVLAIYGYDFWQDVNDARNYFIRLRLANQNEASNPEFWMYNSPNIINCLIPFKPASEFTSSYNQALITAINRVGPFYEPLRPETALVNLAYPFIINSVGFEKDIISSLYVDADPGKDRKQELVGSKLVMLSNEVEDLIFRIEDNYNQIVGNHAKARKRVI